MPSNFLQNSIDQFNRGWRKMYGEVAPAAPARVSPSQQPQPLSPADIGQLQQSNIAPQNQPNQPISVPPTIRAPIYYSDPSGNSNPISRDPAVGQPLGADDGTQGSQNGFLSWLQNFFSQMGGQQQQQAPLNAPLQDPNMQVGPVNHGIASPTTAAGTAGLNDAAGSTSMGGGSGGGGIMGMLGGGAGGGGGSSPGGGILSGIGSGLSNYGKAVGNDVATYVQPPLQLPQRAVFVAPTLSPNRNA